MAKYLKILQTNHDEAHIFTNFQLLSSSGQFSMADRFSFLFSLNSNRNQQRTAKITTAPTILLQGKRKKKCPIKF
jgi:hypothetical protein